jgi:hypothetical protein
MPPLFVFAFSAERALDRKMREMAARNEHIMETAVWAERKHAEQNPNYSLKNEIQSKDTNENYDMDTNPHLMDLYRLSVEKSGVRVVPELQLHHKIANFWQEHPFRILAAVSVPALAYIFHGRNGQEHLQLQMKIMHTRIFGQFTVLVTLLTLMGFKSYMDQHGKFISETEAEERVAQMAEIRQSFLMRLKNEKHLDIQKKKEAPQDEFSKSIESV